MVGDLRLLLAAAAFLVETLARLERRVIDEGIVSVPLPPVSNSVSPSPYQLHGRAVTGATAFSFGGAADLPLLGAGDATCFCLVRVTAG